MLSVSDFASLQQPTNLLAMFWMVGLVYWTRSMFSKASSHLDEGGVGVFDSGHLELGLPTTWWSKSTILAHWWTSSESIPGCTLNLNYICQVKGCTTFSHLVEDVAKISSEDYRGAQLAYKLPHDDLQLEIFVTTSTIWKKLAGIQLLKHTETIYAFIIHTTSRRHHFGKDIVSSW